jgi:hypothetical protein
MYEIFDVINKIEIHLVDIIFCFVLIAVRMINIFIPTMIRELNPEYSGLIRGS